MKRKIAYSNKNKIFELIAKTKLIRSKKMTNKIKRRANNIKKFKIANVLNFLWT